MPRRDIFDIVGYQFSARTGDVPLTFDDPYDVESLSGRPAWHADALCAEPAYRPAWWFPERENAWEHVPRAREVCARCLVHDECKAWALAEGPELEGIWAGLTKGDRHEIRMGRRAA